MKFDPDRLDLEEQICLMRMDDAILRTKIECSETALRLAHNNTFISIGWAITFICLLVSLMFNFSKVGH